MDDSQTDRETLIKEMIARQTDRQTLIRERLQVSVSDIKLVFIAVGERRSFCRLHHLQHRQ